MVGGIDLRLPACMSAGVLAHDCVAHMAMTATFRAFCFHLCSKVEQTMLCTDLRIMYFKFDQEIIVFCIINLYFMFKKLNIHPIFRMTLRMRCKLAKAKR
jgi:hypothetical protein